MKVIHQNRGRKAPYSVDGSVLTLGESSEIQVDVDQSQRDVETLIDVYVGPDGALTRELGERARYAAVVRIPPRSYAPQEVEEETSDGSTYTVTQDVPQPVNPSACTLMLWGLPAKQTEEETA